MIKLIIFESFSFYMTDFDILLYFVGKGLFYYLKTIMASNQRRQWHPTQVLLPGKSHNGGTWWAAVHGVAKIRT